MASVLALHGPRRMVKHGCFPYLECSSRGDTRFSPFFARIKARGDASIEELYQGAKVFKGGVTGQHWRKAKGRRAINQDECDVLYRQLWDEYIAENPELLKVLLAATGVSDGFGKPGDNCQANELWAIRALA